MSRPKRLADCHPSLPRYGHGLCQPCYQRRWALANRERLRAADRAWRARNRKKDNAESALYNRTHRDERREYERRYYRANPAARLAKNYNRIARIKGNGGSHTASDWAMLLGQYGARCGYCAAEGFLERDHRIPISRGGSNDISNIIPACRRCNLKKGALTENEFRELLLSAA